MSYKLAAALLSAMLLTIVIWAGSLFFDYNLARQLLLAVILPAILYLVMDFRDVMEDGYDV